MSQRKNREGFFESGMFLFLGAITIVAIYLSYYVELVIYRSIFNGIDVTLFNGITITVICAATFNCAKIGVTWVLSHLKVTGNDRLAGLLLRSVLIINSLLMTIFLVTGQFTAPNVQMVYDQKVNNLVQKYYKLENDVYNRHETQLEQLKRSYDEQVLEIKERYGLELKKYDDGMDYEMSNVVNGNWKGKRYQEWQEKYDKTLAQRNQELGVAQQQYRKEITVQNETLNTQIAHLNNEKHKAFEDESIEKYLDTYESQNQHVIGLIGLIGKVSNISVGVHHIVLLVAVLITLIIEFIPLFLGGFLFTRILSLQLHGNERAGRAEKKTHHENMVSVGSHLPAVD